MQEFVVRLGLIAILASALTVPSIGQGRAKSVSMKAATLTATDYLPHAIRYPIDGKLPVELVGAGVQIAAVDKRGTLEVAPTKPKGTKTRVGKSPKVVAITSGGREQHIVIYRDAGSFFASPADLWRGKVSRQEMTFLDGDLDGRWDGDNDWLRVGTGCFYRQNQLRLAMVGDVLMRYAFDDEKKRVTVTPVPKPEQCNDLQWRALSVLNRFRSASGLSPMLVDLKRSDACQKHAVYLFLNGYDYTKPWDGVGSHNEVPGNPGYTKEGHDAAQKHATSGTSDAASAIDGQSRTMLHRTPLIGPVNGFGVGACDQSKVGTSGYSVIGGDKPSVEKLDELVIVPAPNQVDVPHFIKGERPNVERDPAFYQRGRGYPISVTYGRLELTDITIELASGKRRKQVVGDLFSHEKPIHRTRPSNSRTAFFVAGQSLSGKTQYYVTFRAKHRGQVVERRWTFKTK